MITCLPVPITVLEAKPRASHMLHKCFATELHPTPTPVIPSFENRYLGQMPESVDKLYVYEYIQGEFSKYRNNFLKKKNSFFLRV